MKQQLKNHENNIQKTIRFSRGSKIMCFCIFGGCLNQSMPKNTILDGFYDFWWVSKIHLLGVKVGHWSSSLSWTVQINRNRSRPGADRVRFGIDLAPRTYFSRFWDGFGSILGWFSMNLDVFFPRDFPYIGEMLWVRISAFIFSKDVFFRIWDRLGSKNTSSTLSLLV